MPECVCLDLGAVSYPQAMKVQKQLLAEVHAVGDKRAYLLLAEHYPAVITLGRRGSDADVLASPAVLTAAGVTVVRCSRGGAATYHGPGQLVAYPIVQLKPCHGAVRRYVASLEEAVIGLLEHYAVTAGRRSGQPGVWVGDEKIASVGLAVSGWVAWHGLSLNVSGDLSGFGLIVPCGLREAPVTSLRRLLNRDVDMADVKEVLRYRLMRTLGLAESCTASPSKPRLFLAALCQSRPSPTPKLTGHTPLPRWMRRPLPRQIGQDCVPRVIADLGLRTVCTQARCPNRPECLAQGRATFLILGDCCTRACRFCAVPSGPPGPIDPDEPANVATAARRLRLHHVVVTSVTRDDLADGGAEHFARTIQAIRRGNPAVTVEVLVPDFHGSRHALETVLAARPDVLGHNLETVRRLHRVVRPQGDYQRSLDTLAWAAKQATLLALPTRIKSGLMAGLGESPQELLEAMQDLYASGCRALTLGQYLAPSRQHHPVVRFIPPQEFSHLRAQAERIGFTNVVAEPLARSSYRPAMP